MSAAGRRLSLAVADARRRAGDAGLPRKVAEFLAFQLTWFACVLGAARGLPWLGPLAALALASHFVWAARRRERALGLLTLALLLGLIVDSSLVISGRLVFPELTEGPWPPLAPPWILALWLALTTTLGSAMGWLAGRPALAALLGGISGPFTYAAGARLGAVELGSPLPATVLAVAIAWAISLPLLMKLQGLLCPAEPAPA